jgi:equilibrative nucleoside transporter 1/2/3
MAVFALLAVLETVVPDHEYGVLYFLMFMVLVFISSLGTALAQNGTMSIANVLGARYAQGVMVGQATAGVLPSLSLMVSNYMYYGKTDAGSGSMSIVLYFLLTVLVALVAGVLFFICDRIDDDVVDFEVVVPKLTRHVPFRTLFKKLKWSALAIFTVFLFSLVFPIFAGQVTSVHSGGRLTEDSVFIPFAFFVWNLGDLTGRVVCSYPRLVVDSDKKLFTYSLLRSLLIPLFFLCNLQDATPRVPSDLFYLAVQFVFGFTNGHCVSSSFMGMGKYVSGEELEASGAFCNVFLSMGLLGGSLLSYVFAWM